MTAAEIISRISLKRGVTVTQIKGSNRTAMVTMARHEALWLTRRLTGLSLPEIGSEFKRDHSTVLSGIKRIQRMVDAHPEYGAELLAIVEATPLQQYEAAIADTVAVAAELMELRARLREFAERIRGAVREAA